MSNSSSILVWPNGTYHKFRVRSLVGLIPLFGVEVIDEATLKALPEFEANFLWFLRNRTDMTDRSVTRVEQDGKVHYVLKLVDDDQLKRVLARVADTNEFRSPYGLRSLSKFHDKNPFGYKEAMVGYEPAEAISRIKGGNSNWRGPIWFPTAYLLIEALKSLASVHGGKFTFPTKFEGGPLTTLGALAKDLAEGMIGLFRRGKDGRRPFEGATKPFQTDPNWKDLPWFHEYFNPETGEGLGASHQTGWTALAASLIDEWRLPGK